MTAKQTTAGKVSHDSGVLMRWEQFVQRHRLAVNCVVHAMIFSLALLLSFLVRMDAGNPINSKGRSWFVPIFVPCVPFFVGIKLLIFWRFKLMHGGWRYAGIRDVANIVVASWWFLVVAFACVAVFVLLPDKTMRTFEPPLDTLHNYFALFPQGVLVLDLLATVFLTSAVRLGFRVYREELRPLSSEGVRRVLIIGAGDAAENIIREINRMKVDRYRVIGLVDDDPNKRDLLIHGIPVLGATQDIRRICDEDKVEEIIIAMPSASQKQLRQVIALCQGTKLKFQSLPGVRELIDGRVSVSQIRPVQINDLLGREAVELDNAAVGKFLRGRRVLITGAGGSIGSEMCRQVGNYQPQVLILVEQAETPLFDIENELRKLFPQMPLVAGICDIFDRQRVMMFWEKYRPDVVIHAAAHKHVPLMERNPSEAVKNNVLGTRNIADASCRYEVSEFVMISTDKAVNPSSVMGASKRIAEIYTQALNGRPGCKTQFKAVRFGNVLGSSGSVIPTFHRQIAAGGPVTVTHPDMTRYFMTIPEAAQLVLQAAAAGTGGQIFLLDMGEPIKIVSLAEQMITLSGFRPYGDIDIVFTGTRPGEKLFEELRTKGEDIEPTVHPKVLVWKSRPTQWEQVQSMMARFESLQNSMDRDAIVAALRQAIPEYTPLNPPTEQPSATQSQRPEVAAVAAAPANST